MVEQARVDECDVRDDVGAEGVANADERTGHLPPEVVDHLQQITDMIQPRGFSRVGRQPVSLSDG